MARYQIEASYGDQAIRTTTRDTTNLTAALTRVYKRLVRGYPELASTTEHFVTASGSAEEGTWHLYGGRWVPKANATSVGPRVIAHVTIL